MDLLRATLPEQRSEYIRTLDGWRGIAICLVLFSHGFLSHPQTFGYDSIWKRAGHAAITHSGAVGVILFFSISGFLICTRLLNQRAVTGRISLLNFYIRRCFRILPPAFTFLVVLALLVLTGVFPHITDTAFKWKDWFGAAFFFANYNFSRQTWILEHYWSLAVEEQFYLVWPAILVFFGNLRAAKVALVLACGAIVWRLFWLAHAPAFAHPRLLQRTDIRLDSFMIPCFLAISLTYIQGRRILQYLGRSSIQGGIIFLLFAISFASQFVPAAVFLERAIAPLVMTLIVISTVMNPDGWLGRALEVSWLRRIGRLSYSLYLWQALVIFRPPSPQSSFGHMALLFCLRLPIVIALAFLSYYWIEVPFIQWGRRLAKAASFCFSEAKTESVVVGEASL